MTFEEAYDQYFDYVWRLLRRFGVSENNAEDQTQEVFLRLHRQFDHYDPSRSMRAWLGGIAYNVASEHRRLGMNQNELLAQSELPDGGAPAQYDTTMQARQLVERALSCLTEEQRDIVVLYHLHEHTMREIAGILGVNENTCGSRLRGANERLTRLLRQLKEEEENASR